jgi:hypothetical protein
MKVERNEENDEVKINKTNKQNIYSKNPKYENIII